MQADLFSRPEITEASFAAVYCSGAGAYWDALGVMNAGKGVGVVAGCFPARTAQVLRRYAESGGQVMVDSGAFQAWTTGEAIDFPGVIAEYERLLQGLPRSAIENFALVMPDVIGDQEATRRLLVAYKAVICSFIDRGADVIVSLQRGSQPVHVEARTILALIGRSKVRFGIPSNAAALGDSEIARIRHDRFHILGKATLDSRLKRRAFVLLEANPSASITCDANLIRSRLDSITDHHRTLIAATDNSVRAVMDDTELVYSVFHDRAWMTRSEVAATAKLFGIVDESQVSSWLKIHRECGLAPILDEFDPDGTVIYSMLDSLFSESARRAVSARLRSEAVEYAIAA